ncbi:hypothetical protein F4680DRAFT_468347 [Xylaria scruposa]|nr:hypothetical protein F4680DRAFT_468347 [Xylaria scruposa]
MQQSWLLHYSLLIVAATGEVLTHNHVTESGIEVASSMLRQNTRVGVFVSHEVVVSEVKEQETGFKRLLSRITDPTGIPLEGEAAALRIPRPTAMPSLQKRQDDGQIQALSAQLQSLSQSATEAISSVSSSASSILSQMSQSAQSVRQSADQAMQSANQAADQANRQLSQTVSSASSAVSAADARASSQISQSLASMSSRFSTSLASAQSSASDAVSSARVAASQFAASQIQAAAASGVRGDDTNDTNSPVEQSRPSSVSSTTLAIIIVVSVVGTAILSTVSTYLLLRYRRKRRSIREEKALADNERTVAVRGSPSPRFPRFGGGPGSTADGFKLPRLSLALRSKKAQREARYDSGSAASGYSDQEESISSKQDESDLDGAQTFRLQKDNGVSSATTVRLIRVGSDKGKARSSIDIQPSIPEPTPPLPMVSIPYQSLKPTLVSTQNQPTTQPPPQAETIITQPPKSKEPPQEERRVSAPLTGTSDAEKAGWRPSIRPSVRLTATDPNRFRFRDSSDLESGEPTPTNLDNTRLLSSPNTLSLRTPRTSNPPGQMNRSDFRRTAPPGQPKNGKGTFATFPRIRNQPPRESMMNRGRPRLENRPVRLRGDEDRRLRELVYMSGSMDPRRNTLNYR